MSRAAARGLVLVAIALAGPSCRRTVPVPVPHTGTAAPVAAPAAPSPSPAPSPGAAGHAHAAEGAAGHVHAGPAQHRFEDADRWAKVFDDPARDVWQRPQLVVDLMRIEKGMTVADLGAGTGYFLPHLSRAVGGAGRVLALDVESDMVRHMRARVTRDQLLNVEVHAVGPDDPGLGPASVDRVLVVDTWHHIGERVAYARKLARALRPGGEVHVVDFTLEAPRGPRREHRLPPSVVVDELTKAGLQASVAAEELPDQYVVIGRLRPAR